MVNRQSQGFTPVEIDNFIRFRELFGDLQSRQGWQDKTGLIYGANGLGKTTSLLWLKGDQNFIHLEWRINWGEHAFLDALLKELGLPPSSKSSAKKFDEAAERMIDARRPLVIDESNFLFEGPRRRYNTSLVRQLGDATRCTILLAGTNIETSVNENTALAQRVGGVCEFRPLALVDCQKMLASVSPIAIAKDLAEQILADTGGLIRPILAAGRDAALWAKRQGLQELDLATYRNRRRAA